MSTEDDSIELEETETTSEATPDPAAAAPPAIDPADMTEEERVAADAQAEETKVTAARDARIAAAKDAEKRTAQSREARRVERANARSQFEREQLAKQRAEYDAQKRADAEAIQRGGLDALKARTGMTYDELTKRWITDSSPEGRERAEQQRKQQELETKLAELTAREQQRAVEQVFEQLDAELEKRADDFPHAYEMPRRMFRAAVPIIAENLAQSGRRPTHGLVLKALDEIAKSEHDERESRRTRLQTRSKKPSDGVTPQSQSPTANRATVRTLSNADSSERSRVAPAKTADELEEEVRQGVRKILSGT